MEEVSSTAPETLQMRLALSSYGLSGCEKNPPPKLRDKIWFSCSPIIKPNTLRQTYAFIRSRSTGGPQRHFR
ncbi:hypothetical protein TNCV_3961231 [Trichonephila clavipes]|nr:hypothetical protein TNCV_3961231 [Trichonephila clavipes]